MPDDVKENIEKAKDFLLNRHTDEAKEKLLKNTTMQYSLQDDQNNQEIKQQKQQIETELDPKTDDYKNEQDNVKIKQKQENNSEIEQQLYLIEHNSFQMRRQVLEMELNVVKTFSFKALIGNKDDTFKKIHYIKTHLDNICDAHDMNNFEKPKNDLLIIENLSTELMKRIKKVIKKKAVKKEEVKKHEDHIEVPDYRSIVTVRGTEEDVKNCILKAELALQNGKYDRAETLLMKAERILPTKNARKLLTQVQAAKVLTQKLELIDNNTEAVEQENTVKQKETKPEDTISASKCLTAFENAFAIGNLEKAERMLKKAQIFDPSLNVEEKLSLIKAAISKKNIEENRKEQIEKASRERKTADEYIYKLLKTNNSGNLHNAEQVLLQARTLHPMLNSEPGLSKIKTKVTKMETKEANTTCSVEEIRNADKVKAEKNITKSVRNRSADYLNDAKKDSFSRIVENQVKLNSEITSLETNFLCFEDEKQRQKVAEKGKSKMRNGHQPDVNKTFEKQERSKENNMSKTDKRVKNDADVTRHKISGNDAKGTINKSQLEFVKRARYLISINDLENAKIALLFAYSFSPTPYVKSLLENVEKGLEQPKPNKKRKRQRKKEQAEKPSMVAKAFNYDKFENATNSFKGAGELYPTARAKKTLSKGEEIRVPLNCHEFSVYVNETYSADALKSVKIALEEDQYDRPEPALCRTQRIFARRAQYKNKVTGKTEKNNKKRVNVHTLFEKMKGYKKYSHSTIIMLIFGCTVLVSVAFLLFEFSSM